MPHDENHPDQLAEIFSGANALPPGPERDALIAESCGEDLALREEVLRLVGASGRAGEFMARRFGAGSGDATCLTEKPGDRIGPYTLLGKLGEGGCGIVYKALREAPLRRTVALKIVKPGMDTKSVVARFEAERQALALMEHPHIAQVYEAGTTENGRPYFAMELVHGTRITDYCTQHRLSAAERLQLFVKVCHAVQHAHQKGVIHRDLKPANVMVTEEDGVPAPKIIDFGIAKAMGSQLTEHTIYTALEQFIGTPAYMSPEQVAGSVADIDTRSDIYSLGVLLYEMLTGSPPFDQRSMLAAGMEEMRRVIREDEPARPSTRILQRTRGSDGSDAVDSGEKSRQTTPDLKETVHRLRGDLDWVIMKCLEKERERRYSSANSLAGDIERHLRNEPVLATPPSLSYRLRKLALRHKTAVVAGALVLLALVAGLIASTWGMVRAHQEERKGAKLLWESLVAQARAMQLSNQPGRRFEGLALLQRARRIANDLQLPEEDRRKMRNAATSALSVSDLQFDGPSVAFGADAAAWDFDESFSLCAITTRTGDCSIRRVADDTEICHLPGLGRPALVQFSADGKYVSVRHFADDMRLLRKVQVWALEAHRPRCLIDESLTYASVFLRSEQIALGSDDGSIRVLSLPDAKEQYRLSPGRAQREIGLSLHPSEPLIAAWSFTADQVEIRDLRDGTTVHSIPVDASAGNVTWTPDGKRLAIGFFNSKVSFYNRTTWELDEVIPTRQVVTGIAFTPDGSGMAINGWNNIVEVFDTASHAPNMTWPRPQAMPRFSADGSRLASALQGGRAGTFKVGAPAVMRSLTRRSPGPEDHYTMASLHPGGRLLAVAMEQGIGFWDLLTGREEAFLPTEKISLNRVLFDASGNLLTGTINGISRWPVSIGAEPGETVRIGAPTRLNLPLAGEITQSRDGRVIATADRSVDFMRPHAGVHILHMDRPESVLQIQKGADMFKAAISPDGLWVVTLEYATGISQLWNAQNGELVKRLDGWGGSPPWFSDDGRWFVTCGHGGRLFSTKTWEPVRSVDAGAFIPSPDGTLAAVAEESGIRLIEIESGREVAMLERPDYENVGGICFSPDGATLIVFHGKLGLEIWDLRLLREKLKEMDLDWNWPAFPPAPVRDTSAPFRVILTDNDARP